MTLDDIKTYTKLDTEEISFGIEHLPEQAKIAWEGTRLLEVPEHFKKTTQVFVAGMGGSILGPRVLQSVYASVLRLPIEMVNGYRLPASATKKSLLILSSFSGSTEEVLAVGKEGKKQGVMMAVCAAGGKLAAFAKKEGLPLYRFEPGEYAKVPRLGVGFTLVGILGILERCGVIDAKEKDIRSMMAAMGEVVTTCAIEVPSSENPAKIVALECLRRPLLIVAAEHLLGNANIFQNQVNETAKHMAFFDSLPELNHHRLEGLTHPEGNFAEYTVIMLRSELYHARVQKRFDLTAEVFETMGARVIDYNCGGGGRLDEAGEVLQFSSFVSYYLAMAEKVEGPEKTPYVDWFKEKMGKGR